jgi:hypothetical protein
MRRLLPTAAVALLALLALGSSAFATTPKPTITSFSPGQVPVNGVLVLKGKNFAPGSTHNRVYFSRATDGKTVRVRPRKATKTRMEVVVPVALTQFLGSDSSGGRIATRFRISIFTRVLGPKTGRTKSPFILPAGSSSVPTGSVGGTTPSAPAPDCDGDGIPNATDTDDDNDQLPDDTELKIGTDPCNADTDHDKVDDGYEYYSALDLNGNALPYPGKRQYPNALDGSDAGKDFDGDGMTSAEEFAAWNLYGGRVLPATAGQSFPYSDGNQRSTAPNGPGAMDLDNNGRITDDEKDADADGLPNWAEMAKGDTVAGPGCAFTPTTGPTSSHYANAFTDCGATPMPNGQTFGDILDKTTTGAAVPPFDATNHLNYLDPDSDGDGINDGADDLDYDDVSNLEEVTAGADGYYSAPIDPCDPNEDSRTCPIHPAHA